MNIMGTQKCNKLGMWVGVAGKSLKCEEAKLNFFIVDMVLVIIKKYRNIYHSEIISFVLKIYKLVLIQN